jgi:hypothetical protein
MFFFFFGKNSRVRNEVWDGCVVVTQRPVLLTPNFGVTFSHIFTQSSWNVTVVWDIYCLALWNEFFMNTSFNDKENYESILDFALQMSQFFFCLFWTEHANQTPLYDLGFSYQNACLSIAMVSVTLIPSFAQNFVKFICRIHCIRPDTRL